MTNNAIQNIQVNLTGNQTVAGIKDFTSFPTFPNAMPVNPQDGVNKLYADTIAAGLSVRQSCDIATDPAVDTDITLSGEQTIDGVLTSASRVLVKNQVTLPETNGIYTTGAGAWVRTADYNATSEVDAGTFTTIINGTLNANTQWVQTAQAPVINVDPLVFSILAKQSINTASLGVKKVVLDFELDFVANDGLKLSGNSATIDYDNTTIGIVANKLAIKNSGVTAGAYIMPTVTFDAAGRATAAVATALATGKIFRGTANLPVATTATYPDTVAVNNVLGGTAANVIGAINNGVMSGSANSNIGLQCSNTNTSTAGFALIRALNSAATGANMAVCSSGLTGGGGVFGTLIVASDTIFYHNNAVGKMNIGTTTVQPIVFFTGGSALANERMRITSGGAIGIGTSTPDASAILDITSTLAGLLVPRMTTVQKNLITAVNGLILYDTTLNKFQGYENGAWSSFI
jgi:hypothetical protein